MPALTEAEIAQRVHSIGSSEVAAVLGINPHCSPHQVWLSKMGLADFEGNDATEAGNDFEEVILRRLARHNRVELLPSRHVIGPEPWITSTPDAFIRGGGIAEAKMVGWHSMWMWGSEADGVAYPYLCQVQHQLLCSKEPFCLVGAQMGTEHRYYRVLPDAELQAIIIEQLRAFWFSYVVPRVPPPVDESAGATEMLRKLYPRSEKAFRFATPEENALAARIVAAEEIADAKAAVVAKLKNEMRHAVTDWERVIGDGWRVRYKTSANKQRPFYFEPQKKNESAA
jgi:predicted phage-related endonuclease